MVSEEEVKSEGREVEINWDQLNYMMTGDLKSMIAQLPMHPGRF